MRSMLLVTMLALGTVLVAGAAEAGPVVTVWCSSTDKIEVGFEDEPTLEGTVDVYAPYAVLGPCPMN